MDYLYIYVLFLFFLIWVPWIIRYVVKPRFEKNDLEAWLATHPKRHYIKQCQAIFDELYRSVKGQQVSLRERSRLKIESDAFVYGEIEFLSFAKVLDIVKPRPGEIFYDLGCGAGKAVYAAALLYDLHRACGIEVLPGVYQLASSLQRKFQQLVDVQLPHRNNPIIQFVNADIFDCDISDADIVFVNATCFSGRLWESILDKLNHLKPGSRVLITTKKLQLPQYQLIYEQLELMSWGLSTMRVYKAG